MKDAIGGYFSLELPLKEEFHKDAIRLNTGRNCLEYILRARNYKCVYIPYYTCEVILEPFKKLGIEYRFYHIDINFEIAEDIKLESGEALLYTNYFGLKQRYTAELAERYENRLIVDNTQAFFAPHISGIDTFYTCRKFFGVPDGAYLYTDSPLSMDMEQDVSYGRMMHLLKRIDLSAEEGFRDFRNADDGLDEQPVRRMSKLTQRLMQSIDYVHVAKVRRKNYEFLDEQLSYFNLLHFILDKDIVPMVYPFMVSTPGLQEKMIKNRIFSPIYWFNVLRWCADIDTEFIIANNTVFIPVDQRYSEKNMNEIIMIIVKYGFIR